LAVAPAGLSPAPGLPTPVALPGCRRLACCSRRDHHMSNRSRILDVVDDPRPRRASPTLSCIDTRSKPRHQPCGSSCFVLWPAFAGCYHRSSRAA